MNANEERVRIAIADIASERFVANDDGPLDTREEAVLTAWLKDSPAHIEEFLGVSVIARDLRAARLVPAYSIDAVLARVRSEPDSPARLLWPRLLTDPKSSGVRRWQGAAVTLAAFGVLGIALALFWNTKPAAPVSTPDAATVLHLQTRHGEQLSRRLADNTVLHLNTDSAVAIRYTTTERLVTLTSGQAAFEVTHTPDRAFRVIAGSADVVDLGTTFDVRLERDSTVVTVVEGRVAVGRAAAPDPAGSGANRREPPPVVQLVADQQLRVTENEPSPKPTTVNAQSTTAWLHRQIVFDHEPLERVVAEYNRYTAKPIEISSPSLRTLQISGVFAIDDPDALIAFLRGLKGVRIEVTAKHIRVSRP